MRALIAYGSKRGGTAELARTIASALEAHGIQADVREAGEAGSPEAYDAVIVAGALYMNRWHRQARRFVRRQTRALRELPVWLVSSGPLDDSTRDRAVPPVRQVAKLMARISARGHATFGGRLAPDASGFPASAMAKTASGDWRNLEQVEAFAATVAADLLSKERQSG